MKNAKKIFLDEDIYSIEKNIKTYKKIIQNEKRCKKMIFTQRRKKEK